MEEIKETLKKQLKILSEQSLRAGNVKECCLINKEMRKTARIIMELETADSAQLVQSQQEDAVMLEPGALLVLNG